MSVKLKYTCGEINAMLGIIKKQAITIRNLDSTLLSINNKIKELENKINQITSLK